MDMSFAVRIARYRPADKKAVYQSWGNADDEEITQALVENDLCWYARVGASENDGERFLALCEAHSAASE